MNTRVLGAGLVAIAVASVLGLTIGQWLPALVEALQGELDFWFILQSLFLVAAVVVMVRALYAVVKSIFPD